MIRIDEVCMPSGDDYLCAIRGMRNSYDSWASSDSNIAEDGENFELGSNDYELMKKLAKAGPSHSKFLRFLFVSCDITAPLYWWKEFDTYRMGVEKNSCSTMHRITSKPFIWADFSAENIAELGPDYTKDFDQTIANLNRYRKEYLAAVENKQTEQAGKIWRVIIQTLPESYQQKRTVTMSYAALLNMYNQRRNHKLVEWRYFCKYWKKKTGFDGIFGGEND